MTILALSASAATSGGLPILAILSLPLLSRRYECLDTGDSLLMTRAYSLPSSSPNSVLQHCNYRDDGFSRRIHWKCLLGRFDQTYFSMALA